MMMLIPRFLVTAAVLLAVTVVARGPKISFPWLKLPHLYPKAPHTDWNKPYPNQYEPHPAPFEPRPYPYEPLRGLTFTKDNFWTTKKPSISFSLFEDHPNDDDISSLFSNINEDNLWTTEKPSKSFSLFEDIHRDNDNFWTTKKPSKSFSLFEDHPNDDDISSLFSNINEGNLWTTKKPPKSFSIFEDHPNDDDISSLFSNINEDNLWTTEKPSKSFSLFEDIHRDNDNFWTTKKPSKSFSLFEDIHRDNSYGSQNDKKVLSAFRQKHKSFPKTTSEQPQDVEVATSTTTITPVTPLVDELQESLISTNLGQGLGIIVQSDPVNWEDQSTWNNAKISRGREIKNAQTPEETVVHNLQEKELQTTKPQQQQ